MSEQQQVAALKMDLSELTQKIDMKLKARLEQQHQPQQRDDRDDGATRLKHASDTAEGDGNFSMIVTTQMKRNGSKRYHNTAWQSHSDRKRTNTSGGGSTPQDLRSPTAATSPSSFSYTAPPPATTIQGQRPVTVASFAKPVSGAATLPTPAPPTHRGSLALPPPPPPRNYGGGDSITQSQSVPDLSGPRPPQSVVPSHDQYQGRPDVQRQWSDQTHDRPVPTDGRYQKLHVYLHGVPPGHGTTFTERERMFALEAKFGQIKQILEAVGVEVPW